MHLTSKLAGLALILVWALWIANVSSFAEAPCGGVEAVPSFAEGNQEIRIADVAFSRSMRGYCPSERLGAKIKKPKQLYFWMRLEAGLNAVEKLKKDGGLPIKHRWSAFVGHEIEPDWEPEYEDIQATDAMGHDAVQLSSEVEVHGFFDWRTQTMKERTYEGSAYKIEILDAHDNPIPCAEDLDCLPCKDNIRCAVVMRVR